jgi:hypothetical protein
VLAALATALASALAACARPPRLPITYGAFPAPQGLEGMPTRVPEDLRFASGFVYFLGRAGIRVREVAPVRPGDFFADAPRAVRLVTEFGDAEVLFVRGDAADRWARSRAAFSRPAPADSGRAGRLYFVARRDVFVVTGSVVLYDAMQRALREARTPSAT